MDALYLSEMSPSRISECKSRYCAHPSRLVQIGSFLSASVVDTISGLLSKRVEFGSVYGLHETPGHIVERDEWLKSEGENRFFHYEMMTGIAGAAVGKDTLTFLKLRQFLSSDAFCEFGRQVTDEDIASVTEARIHRLRQGHYLRPHNDRSGTRKIAYILYLGRGWQSQFGGQLTLVGKDGSQHQYEPIYNSLLLFDVTQNKEHHIEELTSQSKGFSRDTMSGWFLSEAKS